MTYRRGTKVVTASNYSSALLLLLALGGGRSIRPSPSSAAAAASEGVVVATVRHDERPHLTPRQYGEGLRRKRLAAGIRSGRRRDGPRDAPPPPDDESSGDGVDGGRGRGRKPVDGDKDKRKRSKRSKKDKSKDKNDGKNKPGKNKPDKNKPGKNKPDKNKPPKKPPNKKPSGGSKPKPKPRPQTSSSGFANEPSSSQSQLQNEKPGRESDCPPTWTKERRYAGGDLVAAKGRVYECKPHPHDGWCSHNAQFEPSAGVHWTMAWDAVDSCDCGECTPEPTPKPVKPRPTPKPVKPRPTPRPVRPTQPSRPSGSGGGSKSDFTNNKSTVQRVYDMLDNKRSSIDGSIFLYQGKEPSTVYRYEGFISGLRIMVEDGVAKKHFYLGDGSPNGHLYGLANIAAFLGQSMKETIQYDACDENNWDYLAGGAGGVVYPLSNACGQLEQDYQDYHCPEHERHMECEVDSKMSLTGTTHAKWYGAPGPFFCGPKSEYEQTGIWDHTYACNDPWANPPRSCDVYEGQKAGRYDNSRAVANRNGRTDVEGCCWWGRGVIQTTGICNFGKLNYYLGARAKKEGRDSRYPKVDFCKDPGIICSSREHNELKWIAGMFYWLESLQSYDERGWNYMKELHKFVDGGMTDNSFIDGVSGVVNRGCHDPPCGTGPVDGLQERAGNFNKVLTLLTS